MYGFPGMSFVTADGGSGQQIGAAAQRNPASDDLAVRLAAGGVAHAWLQLAQAELPGFGLPASHGALAAGVPARRHRGRLRGPGLPGLRRHQHAAADRHAGPLGGGKQGVTP